MLSVASVKSASGAAQYFAKDDYYTAEHSSEATAWGGVGAADLGLKGEVTKEDFEKILNGEMPDGEKVGQVEQYRDTAYEADANTDANPFAISAETQGYEFGVIA